MREPEEEKVPIGIPLPDMAMDQFMDLEDEPDRFERVSRPPSLKTSRFFGKSLFQMC
jgi:hypothetical protein